MIKNTQRGDKAPDEIEQGGSTTSAFKNARTGVRRKLTDSWGKNLMMTWFFLQSAMRRQQPGFQPAI